MVDWDLAVKIASFGLGAVFVSLAVLVGVIYLFGKILEIFEKKGD